MPRPKLLTPRQVENGIKRYFKSITITRPRYEYVDKKDKGNTIKEKKPVLNDLGKQVCDVEFIENPSLGGLSLFLGIHRETLLNYSKDPEYFDTIKVARQKIENYLEDHLYGPNVTGVIFNLKNNFGWKDKTEVELSAKSRLEDFFGDD